MARFQDLPDRSGSNAVCGCAVIPDLTMCQNNAMIFECSIATASSKNRLEVYGTSCTWTVPTGVTSIVIEMWGAGGGGGGMGHCCCCSNGLPGSGGAYLSATIPVTGGSVYTICGGTGGNYGCGGSTGPSAGNPSYVTGPGLSTFCAGGGQNGWNSCNETRACFSWNNCNATGIPVNSGNTTVGNVVGACGEGSHRFGRSQGCRHDAISGSAPFGGGAGVWTTYDHCCPYNPYLAPAGQFPGGGGGGARADCCCGGCTCGACGAAGLVRIWF